MNDFPSPTKYLSPGSTRWSASKKAELVEKVLDGEIKLEDALRLHGFSPDEFSALVTKFGQGGYAALRQKAIRPTARKTTRRPYGVAKAIATLISAVEAT